MSRIVSAQLRYQNHERDLMRAQLHGVLGGIAAGLILGVGIAGYALGGEAEAMVARATTQQTELATAQLLSHQVDVRWVGYLCGDDGATVISENLPSECVEARRLNDTDILDAPLYR